MLLSLSNSVSISSQTLEQFYRTCDAFLICEAEVRVKRCSCTTRSSLNVQICIWYADGRYFDRMARQLMNSHADVLNMSFIPLCFQTTKTITTVKCRACHLYHNVKTTADSESAISLAVLAQLSKLQLGKPQVSSAEHMRKQMRLSLSLKSC